MPISAYLQSIGFFALAVAALLVSAGTAAILTYWAYLAIFAAAFVASFLLLDPDLARERMRPGGQKPPLGLRIFTGVMFAHWIIAGLDHGRFHWSDTVPGWLQWLSLVALAAAYALCLWAMIVNRFFSSVVRIQSDRGQVVITSGPYAVIRHPGYVAGIAIIVTSGLALELMVCDRVPDRLQSAVPAVPRGHRRPCAAGAIAGLSRLRPAGPMAARSGGLVRARSRGVAPANSRFA